jgi:hypothetical protein
MASTRRVQGGAEVTFHVSETSSGSADQLTSSTDGATSCTVNLAHCSNVAGYPPQANPAHP